MIPILRPSWRVGGIITNKSVTRDKANAKQKTIIKTNGSMFIASPLLLERVLGKEPLQTHSVIEKTDVERPALRAASRPQGG
jgi:hypothetical protein